MHSCPHFEIQDTGFLKMSRQIFKNDVAFVIVVSRKIRGTFEILLIEGAHYYTILVERGSYYFGGRSNQERRSNGGNTVIKYY